MASPSSRIVPLAELDATALEALAVVTLGAARDHSPTWLPDLDAAREEVDDALAPRKRALVLLEEGGPVGWVAAEHAWGTLWELHPLMVSVAHHRRGHGRRLVRAIEAIAAEAGALTMMLGTSDTTGATSVGNIDLFPDPLHHLATIQAHRPHAFSFWRRIGYHIVGILPDADGPGRPSITLARRLAAPAPDAYGA